MNFERPRIIISKCIAFENCRFDGTKLFCKEVKQLKPYVDFMPVCPEIGMGLPSPRESLRLIIVNGSIHLVSTKSGTDMTSNMKKFIQETYNQIIEFQPDGFLLKSRSPSCGIKDVKVYPSIGKVPCTNKKAKGVFAQFLIDNFPQTIFEDDGRITNFSIREHFYIMIFTKAKFKKIQTIDELIEFNEKNNFLFMAYSQNQQKILSRIIRYYKNSTLNKVLGNYELHLNRLLLRTPSKGQVINVMLHIFGYISKELSAKEKAYFLDTLESYQNQHIPQSTVMTLLQSWVIRFDITYLLEQTIFEPFPKELIQVTDSGKGI